MDPYVLKKHFASIGARVKFRALTGTRWRWPGPTDYTLDIGRDRKGQFFDIARASDQAPNLLVLQTVPKERHLVLYANDGSRFLCGHDEREWFVAMLRDRVSTVRDAKRSLMPPEIREVAKALPAAKTAKRKNTVFTRQGEWFFLPVDKEIPEAEIHRKEPLQRDTRSKPHICEELYREGGEMVYQMRPTFRWYTAAELANVRKQHPDAVVVATRIRNPNVFVRGHVSHPDHATIELRQWHRVYLNGEFFGSKQVTFLD